MWRKIILTTTNALHEYGDKRIKPWKVKKFYVCRSDYNKNDQTWVKLLSKILFFKKLKNL